MSQFYFNPTYLFEVDSGVLTCQTDISQMQWPK